MPIGTLTIERTNNTKREPLRPGEVGTRQTLKRMAELSLEGSDDPEIKQLATLLTRGISGHDFKAKANRLFVYVRDEIQYQRDPLMGEHVQAATVTVRRKAGDCDDKSVLLASLLGSIGILSRFLAATYDMRRWSHVYLMAFIPRAFRVVGSGPASNSADDKTVNKWFAYDATPERAPAGWEAKSLRTISYGIFDGELGRLSDASDLIAAGLNLVSTLSAKSQSSVVKLTDAEIAAAVDTYTEALQANTALDPESMWQQALPAVRAPGGGQLTVAASRRLWDLKESRKAALATGATGGTTTGAGSDATTGTTTGAAGGSNNLLLYIALALGGYAVFKGS